MKHLAKIGLILFISTTVSLMAQVSFAENFDFNLTFDNSSSISTVVSNAVVRGDRDRYYFEAQAGQNISIAIASWEDNAVIDLFYKSGEAWVTVPGTDAANDIRVWHGTLPSSESNQYRIDVSGTRGNASYNLFVGISSTAFA